MSGHSKWSTIKRKKEINDSARGKTFGKLSKAITVAVKSGGGTDPSLNYKLRVEIDKAKTLNMPKVNIERAIKKASNTKGFDEVIYEGFGPNAVSILIETVTNNRNRTGQEIKKILDKAGGNLGGPGSVSFNFSQKGLILVEKDTDPETQMLRIIDNGVEEIEETAETIMVYVTPEEINKTESKLEKSGLKIKKTEIIQKPVNTQEVSNSKDKQKIYKLLNDLETHDDVQRVFSNLKEGKRDKLE